MVKRSYKREEIVPKLRHVDVVHSQGRGMTIADAVRDIGVSEVKFYRWYEDHGGINTVQLKRIKEMEKAKVAPISYISPRFRGLGGKELRLQWFKALFPPFS